jgi:SAM-dependent methyltransferase
VRYYARVFRRFLGDHRTTERPRVLEVGCGLGHLLDQLDPHCETWGVDLSTYALGRARVVEPRARLCQARGEQLPFREHSFAGAIIRHVLEHLPEPVLAIDELRRILQPAGMLMAVMPNPTSLSRGIKKDQWIGFRDPTHVNLLTPTQWRDLFEGHGFQVLHQWGDGLWDVPYLPLLPTALQLLLFTSPAALQVLTGGSFMPTRAAESVIFTLRASSGPTRAP